ncbi:hypothetical protein [Alkalihalobacterium elongatum]|uniref:hypothetical protein n=1 Tax=Alkalihalobacterium elongatum TaxID=2675466 RepID=UPI001C1F3433|nr:hypothetical protein [Alkalihalobacterium elongatum]
MKKITTFMLILLSLLLFINALPAVAKDDHNQVSFIVKASGQAVYQSITTVQSDELYHEILKAKFTSVKDLPFSNNYVLFVENGLVRILIADNTGQLFDVQQKKKLRIKPQTAHLITEHFKTLEADHFGKILTWDEATKILPKYTSFKITDLETGFSFNAQRRAGSKHADVQPLTHQDTKVMKAIYGGKWSWNRRAIVVHVNNQVLAASMHGMPHGKGALANGFPGHFCIHFKGSTTHRLKNTDLSHQVMAHKAAGQLDQFTKQLSAEEVIELFLIAVHQKETDILSLIYQGDVHSIPIDNIVAIRKMDKRHQPVKEKPLIYQIPVTYRYQAKDGPIVVETFLFTVMRKSPTDEWKLVHVPFH